MKNKNTFLKNKSLYRSEYFEAQKSINHGKILINPSLNQNIFLLLSIFLLIAIVAFITFAEYTRRETLLGIVSPIGGMIKVKANDTGYIDKLYVKEGDSVETMKPLYKIKTERFDGTGIGIKKRILESVERQLQFLISRREKESEKVDFERNSIIKDIEQLSSQIDTLNRIIKFSSQELNLKNEMIKKQERLFKKRFLSEFEYQKQKLEVIYQLSEIENKKLNLKKLLREKSNLIAKIKNIEINLNITHKEIDGQIETILQNRDDYLYQSDSQVNSPINGIVSSILVKEGHSVSNGQPLLVIVPKSQNSFVELYASSRRMGFINVGQKVRLRFDAFPYEKFGSQIGIVSSISKSAVAPEMIDNHHLIKNSEIEGLYQIRVKLSKPTITVYGREEPLIAGMTVTADIELDTRKIYEWMLEPLYTIKGKI